jgi:hypothetical protein
MPFPYFENISTDFTGTWSSSRKRKAPEQLLPTAPLPKRKRKADAAPCPHSMTAVRSTRQLAAEKEHCPICLEDYFSTPSGRDMIAPVKMACSHVFCRECIETHLSSNPTCPLPWCAAALPMLPDACELCAAWGREHAASGSLVVTVRAREMLGSIKDSLRRLAQEDDSFALPAQAQKRLFAHVRSALKRYEWQYHAGTDLAELLDPFLLAIDLEDTRTFYGPKLSSTTPSPYQFPLREHDADDYETGAEPWVAAFFRQWALDYVKDNGEAKEGWGVWAKKADENAGWEWPYKRILAHRTWEDREPNIW